MERAWARCVAACIAILSGFAAAQPPSGPEFRVNTLTTGQQYGAQVAVNPVTGEFVITWASPPNCLGQRFSAAGAPLGSAISAGCSAGGTATWLPPGGFVTLAVTNEASSGSINGVRFNSSGAVISGSGMFVNTYTTGTKASPRLASDANGHFVAVWSGKAQDGDGYGVFARRFLYSGEPVLLAPETQVNSSIAGDQRGAAIARTPSGEFVIAWHSSPIPGGTCCSRIMAKRFDASGVAVGPDFRVDDAPQSAYFPDVATDTAGNFVVVWHDYNAYGPYTYNVRGQRYSSSGGPLGESFRINGITNGIAGSAHVARSNLGFVVVWSELQGDGSGYAVMGRRFAPNGSPLASIFRVNTYTQGNQVGAAIGSRPGGPFVVAWTTAKGGGSGSDIYAQRFCLGGDVNGDGNVSVADILYLINFLFGGGPPPAGCADVNGSATINVSDLLYLINFVFASGPAPI